MFESSHSECRFSGLSEGVHCTMWVWYAHSYGLCLLNLSRSVQRAESWVNWWFVFRPRNLNLQNLHSTIWTQANWKSLLSMWVPKLQTVSLVQKASDTFILHSEWNFWIQVFVWVLPLCWKCEAADFWNFVQNLTLRYLRICFPSRNLGRPEWLYCKAWIWATCISLSLILWGPCPEMGVSKFLRVAKVWAGGIWKTVSYVHIMWIGSLVSWGLWGSERRLW